MSRQTITHGGEEYIVQRVLGVWGVYRPRASRPVQCPNGDRLIGYVTAADAIADLRSQDPRTLR